MPLLRRGQWIQESPWIRLDDEAPAQASDSNIPVLCSLERFFGSVETSVKTVSGVYLKPEDDITALREHLPLVQQIAIAFPAYTDGRGYSQARLLRQQMQFSGELYAFGDIRPDQLLFMVRAGIDTFEFATTPDTRQVEQILSRFKVNYQPSYALPAAG